jgi:hypothetical protein
MGLGSPVEPKSHDPAIGALPPDVRPDFQRSNALDQRGLRCCGNCACSYVIVQPERKVATPEGPPQPMRRQVVCRRAPPYEIEFQFTEKGRLGAPEVRTVRGLVQSPTTDDSICFDGWRPLGTLPGEKAR